MDMTEIFLGQILPAAFAFAPKGFAQCNGQMLAIAQNQALFSLLGTQYGGDGRVTFALPDLRGRTPVGYSNTSPIGTVGGSESVTLTSQQLPQHVHELSGTAATDNTRNPNGGLLGTATTNLYAPTGGPQVPLAANSVASAGGTQPHENMQPYSVINYCIALTGIYPSRP
jgi:microcystin-dependent protein